MNLNPATASPGQSVVASGTGARRTASRLYVEDKLAVSWTMGTKGTYARTVYAPSGADRLVKVVLKQRRSDGVWAQVDSADLTVKSAVDDPPPPPPPIPPEPKLAYTTSIPAGSSLKGIVSWIATVTAGTPTKVEFRVDGAVHWLEQFAPWGGELDTTQLPDGQHLLEIVGHDAQGAHTPVGGHVTIANAIPAPPPPSGLVWGTGMSGDTRANKQIGGFDRGRIAYRFIALGGHVAYFSVVQRGGPIYSKGDGGRFRATFCGDSNGLPSGTIYGSLDWSPLNPPPNLEPEQGPNIWEVFTDLFPTPFSLPAGPAHLVVENVHADPVNNYASLNVLLSYDGYRQLALGSEFRALYAKPAWQVLDKQIPIFDIGYSDGRHDGQSYIGILFGSGGPNGTMHGEISGAKQVRQRLNPTTPQRIAALNVKVKRIGGASPLIVALEGPGFSEPISIPASAIPQGIMPAGQGAADLGGNTWVRAQLAAARTIDPGSASAMRLSTASDTRYIAVPLQEGTPKGLASYRFLDGAAEQSLNSGQSWNPLYYEPTDLQWYAEKVA